MSHWLLRLKFEDNKVIRYSLKSRTTQKAVGENAPAGGPPDQEVTLTLVQRILRVDEDGSGHVTSVSTPQVPGGESMQNVVYQHLSARGETLLASSPNQGNAFSFPEDAVTIGSSWAGSTESHLPNVPSPIKMNYTYNVEGQEEVEGRSCVKVTFKSDEARFSVPLPDGSGVSQVSTRTEGIMHFDVEAGLLVKLDLSSWTHPRMGNVAFEILNRSVQVLQ